MEGLLGELSAGRCPACSAVRAAVGGLMGWLETAATRGDDLRDLDRLCGAHLRDAARPTPAVAELALRGSIGRWRAMLEWLPPGDALPPARFWERLEVIGGGLRAWRPRRGRWAGSRGGIAATARVLLRPEERVRGQITAARFRRDRPCVACEAMVTASRRTLALLGSVLLAGPDARRYEQTDGLCARHTELALRWLADPARAVIKATAMARSARLIWELDEARRKSSWSVRYEPEGPESSSWSRAILFALGDPTFETRLLATEPAGPVAAA
jgi:hypothetical protein